MLGGVALLNGSSETDGVLLPPASPPDAADDSRFNALTELPVETAKFAEEKDVVHVAIVKTTGREDGIARAVALLGEMDFSGKDVYLKGSYNSPDPFPATTHPDSLGAMVRMLRNKGVGSVTLVERSGMGRTREVMEKLHVLTSLEKLDISLIPLDELPYGAWRHLKLSGSLWTKGIDFPDFLTRNKCVVQLCNLKTHRFGGEFSASLKNTIGLIAKYAAAESDSTGTENDDKTSKRRWNYMMELHSSPHQGQMIAEANQAYVPELVVMDAVEVFVSGGPERGITSATEIIAASCDRVALDAVGFAILQFAGARISVSVHGFDQEQIKHAAKLNLGINSPQKIRIVSDDNTGRLLASRLEGLL